MGKQSAAEIAEVEAPTKKSRTEKTLLDTVAEEDPEEEKRKRKEEKQKRKQAAAAEGETQPMPELAATEGADEDEERRKRKEEKKKRKQEAADAAAAVEVQAEQEPSTKKAKKDPPANEEKPEQFKDNAYKCIDCGEGWTDTAGHQQFRHKQGVAEVPDRCKFCRKKKGKAVAAPTAKVEIKGDSKDAGGKENTAGAPAAKGAAPGTSSAPIPGDSLTVYVGNLPIKCTNEALRKVFSECGRIKNIKVPGKTKGRGIAFITYASKEEVAKALQLNASEVDLDGEKRTVQVNCSNCSAGKPEEVAKQKKNDKAESKTAEKSRVKSEKASELQVFVGGLPFEADEATVKQHFSECGEIASLVMPLNSRQQPRGIALISYKTQEAVDKALLRHGSEFNGRTLKVNKMEKDFNKKTLKANETLEQEVKQHKPEKKSDKGEGNSKAEGQDSKEFKVFVGGLPFECDEATLRETFGKCGEVADFKKIVPSKPEKRPRGIAYITYKTQKGFDKALAFDGTDYEGCTLRVNQAGGDQGNGKDDAHKGKGKGGGKDGKAKGKDGKAKGKGKDGKSKGKKGKDGKGKGKGSKGKKGEDAGAAKKLFDNSDEL